MDAGDRSSAARSSCPQDRGLELVAYGNTPRIPGRQGDSKGCGFASTVSAWGSIRESIEPTGKRVSLDLTIPSLRVKLAEPLAKGSKFLSREGTNLFFDLFDFTHSQASFG